MGFIVIILKLKIRYYWGKIFERKKCFFRKYFNYSINCSVFRSIRVVKDFGFGRVAYGFFVFVF